MKKRILWLISTVFTAVFMAFNVVVTSGNVEVSIGGTPALAHDCGTCDHSGGIPGGFCDLDDDTAQECDSNNGERCGTGSSSCTS